MQELNKVYDSCITSGKIIKTEIKDIDHAKALYHGAKNDWVELLEFEKIREAKTTHFAHLFSMRYDVLRKLIHTTAILDQIKPTDHQCMGAYLCIQHPNLDLDWNTIESMRLLRNHIQYKGKTIDKKRWNEYKFKFGIYIKTLFDFIEKQL